jgi:hypothetical protein
MPYLSQKVVQSDWYNPTDEEQSIVLRKSPAAFNAGVVSDTQNQTIN